MSRSTVAVIGALFLVATMASTPVLAAPPGASSSAKTPERPVRLFNGENLDGWYTWLADTKAEDPRGVFTVRDGMLQVSGDGLGGLITNDDYRNYRLVTEFKWGPKTWGKRSDKARDSGLLVHCVGPDGSHAGGAWPASIESQIIQGGVGDFVVVTGTYADGSAVPAKMTASCVKDRDGENVWERGATPTTISKGRINWSGRDPDWADKLGFRGPRDVDSPDFEWTTMEVVCDGDKITNIVNGVVVNEAHDVFPSEGKILIQTELAEITFRRIELLPLEKKSGQP